MASSARADAGDLTSAGTDAPRGDGDRQIHPVPNPFPLTLAGMLAALGPQAINFGISIGGGEAYLLPNIAARGTLHMHWLMLVSVVLETALVYECIKYSSCTGRSFFAATNELKPYGFWPWFWAVVAILTWAWPAWMGGAVIAAHRFTGIGNPPIWGLPPHYIWAVLALALVLVVFYFSDRTYAFLEKFFMVIMVVNIVLVLLITVIAAKPEHYWQVLMGYLGVTFLMEGYPDALPKTDALALFNQPGGSLMWVSFWVIAAGFGMGQLRRPGHRRAEAAGADHRAGTPLGQRRPGRAAQDAAVGQGRRLQPDPVVGAHRRPADDLPLLGRRPRLPA